MKNRLGSAVKTLSSEVTVSPGSWTGMVSGVSFAKKSSHLAKHKRYHREEKPFGCGQCDKIFAHNPSQKLIDRPRELLNPNLNYRMH